MSSLASKLSKIQVEFKSKKSRFNSFGKYNFRSAEDILEALKPLNEKYEVYFTVSEKIIDTFDGKVPVIQSTATITDGKDSISASAIVGVDLNQKGMQVPQQFGSASSYGKKYALGNLLLIDDTADADAVNTHGKTAAPKTSMTDEQFAQAKTFIAKGGKLSAIEKKYNLTDAQRRGLS